MICLLAVLIHLSLLYLSTFWSVSSYLNVGFNGQEILFCSLLYPQCLLKRLLPTRMFNTKCWINDLLTYSNSTANWVLIWLDTICTLSCPNSYQGDYGWQVSFAQHTMYSTITSFSLEKNQNASQRTVLMACVPPFLLLLLLSQWALFSQHVFYTAQLNVHLDYELVSLT